MERELAVAIEAARTAGVAVGEIWRKQDFTVTEKSGDKGPLTEADLAANEILQDILLTAFPGDGLLSEETKDTPDRLSKRRCWIIDPVDGTREFTLGLPEFCVSVGFVVDGEAKVGALFNPATGQLIAGAVGEGVELDGVPVRVSDHAVLEGARFVVSRSEQKKGWFAPWEGRIALQPVGSVAWKFALVAAGRAEASFTPQPRNEWDLCGGAACILAAGGRATDGSGATFRFNRPDPLHIGVCGTNGRMHDQVMAMMREVG